MTPSTGQFQLQQQQFLTNMYCIFELNFVHLIKIMLHEAEWGLFSVIETHRP